VVVVAGSDAPAERIAALAAAEITVVPADDLGQALVSLRRSEIRSLLVEGGGQLASAFVSAGLIDRLIIFQAPILLGAGATPAFGHVQPLALEEARRFEVIARKRLGSDLMTVYAPEGSVHRAD
jgi:riboflavin biosynthesis pyrimidine reductase